jgi:hypothetical protein
MNTEQYNIVVSQEFLESAKVDVYVPYPDGGGRGEPAWTGLTYLLSGGTNGASVLTGLTIPIMFKQTYKDIGYYSGFDGAIYQKDINNNFIYSGVTGNSKYTLYLYNTSEVLAQDITYTVDWGDNQPTEIITKKYPDYSSHDYAPLTNGTPKTYEVRLSGTAAWGTTVTTKNITMPYTEISFDNPEGEYYFVPRDGYWSGTPVSYKWIFTGDSENNIQAQISSNYTTIPFLVSGFTSSKITQLKQYGPNPYIEGAPVIQKNEIVGYIKNLGPDYTGYTYLNTLYYDFPQGYTLFIANSSGLTENNITPVPIVKEEILIGMVNATEIQSNVFINRGKLSGTESLLRLGEIDNLGDLIKYGYGYFKLTEQ